MEKCELSAANGVAGRLCDGDACVYWRVVEHLDAPEGSGCAIQHFSLLGDSETAAWLLSVKERCERVVDDS